MLKSKVIFFAVIEAKIESEGSTVLRGSNSATHIVYHKDIEPLKVNTQNEPSKDTQKIDYKDLTQKFNLK